MNDGVGATIDRLKRQIPWLDEASATEEPSRPADSLARRGFDPSTRRRPRTRSVVGTTADDSAAGSSTSASSTEDTSNAPSSTEDSSSDLDVTDVEASSEIVLELELTEGEFVRQFVEAREGMVEQQTFVDQLDWSSSKVSRLLQTLEDEGTIVRIRKGRKNLVYTPECAPSDDPFAHLESTDGPERAGDGSGQLATPTGTRGTDESR